jgi:hypothetical protein
MSWTYSGDPSTSTRDEARFHAQDTNRDDQQLSDEEWNYLLTEHSDNAVQAAVHATDILAAQYSRRADKSVGDLSISYNQIAENYRKLQRTLSRRLGLVTAGVFAGGISISDKLSNEQDSDLVKPSFRRGMHDYDGTQTDEYEDT